MLCRLGIKGFRMGRKVISNFHFTNIKYSNLDLVDLYLNHPNLKNLVICCDEFYTEFDSRVSMSKRNRLQSYLIAQTRKINTDLYATSQFSDFVDLRLIRFVDLWIKMSNIWCRDNNGLLVKHPFIFEAVYYDYRYKEIPDVKPFRLDGRPYFNEYRTEQRIIPPDDYIYEKDKSKNKENNV